MDKTRDIQASPNEIKQLEIIDENHIFGIGDKGFYVYKSQIPLGATTPASLGSNDLTKDLTQSF